ncbi:hypothetical protein [Leuconostoc sp.]|uniref:hypothetical protein n=1 Tax=Leuconostoc sp. TaxID=1930076 RepID=UPI002958A4DB|nr:hypothetical protein [Leuconostoc sp.]MDV8936322.1 hypothetical protein [Leuconostoc sp.]
MIRKVIRKVDIWLIFSAFSIVVLLPQINQHSIILGGDSLFHLNRFYDTMMQIKEGNFQYFVSMYGFSESGRIVNALYGPYLAYINGLIMLLTSSWFKYQIVSDFFVNFIGCIAMYYLLRSNQVKKSYSIWISLLYVTTYAINAWIISQQFLAWGAALLPLGVAAGTRMIRDKNNPVKKLELTLVVTVIIQTHVLTSLFLIIILLFFFCWSFIITNSKKQLIVGTISSAIFTIFLTSNVWGALIEVYGSNSLLAPFQNMDPYNNGTISLALDNSQFSIAIAILFLFQIIFIFYKKSNISVLNKGVTIVGLILLISSTKLLSWNYIFDRIPLISTIQFPYRLLTPATIMLLLGLGLTLTEVTRNKKNKSSEMYIILLAIFSLLNMLVVIDKVSIKSHIWQTNEVVASKGNVIQLLRGQKLREAFSNFKEGTTLKYVYKPTPDYVPLPDKHDRPQKPYHEYDIKIAKQSKGIQKKIRDRKLVISWYSTSSEWRRINVVKYSHTQLKLNGTKINSKDYKLSNIGTLSIHSEKGKNELSLSYEPSKWFEILQKINYISWLVLFIFIIKKCFTRLNKKSLKE